MFGVWPDWKFAGVVSKLFPCCGWGEFRFHWLPGSTEVRFTSDAELPGSIDEWAALWKQLGVQDPWLEILLDLRLIWKNGRLLVHGDYNSGVHIFPGFGFSACGS